MEFHLGDSWVQVMADEGRAEFKAYDAIDKAHWSAELNGCWAEANQTHGYSTEHDKPDYSYFHTVSIKMLLGTTQSVCFVFLTTDFQDRSRSVVGWYSWRRFNWCRLDRFTFQTSQALWRRRSAGKADSHRGFFFWKRFDEFTKPFLPVTAKSPGLPSQSVSFCTAMHSDEVCPWLG